MHEDLRPLPPPALRWTCDPARLAFRDTTEVAPVQGVVGQDSAVESLRFGLEIDAPGQNVFVRGLSGTGRLTLVRNLLESIQPACPLAPDRCFVWNFRRPETPRLITLPRGRSRELQRRVDELIGFLAKDLAGALRSPLVQARKAELDGRAEEESRQLTQPFDEELRSAGLTVVPVEAGQLVVPMVAPLIDGQPANPEQLAELAAAGRLDPAKLAEIQRRIRESRVRLEQLTDELQQIRVRQQEEVEQLLGTEARALVQRAIAPLRKDFPQPELATFLDEACEDVLLRLADPAGRTPALLARYRVHVLIDQREEGCPLEVENCPTLERLLGTVERSLDESGEPLPVHMGIRAGSLLRADGGYLVLDAREVASRPEAWTALLRTLRSGLLEIVPPDVPQAAGPVVRPQAVPLRVKVVLLGDTQVYAALDEMDGEFSQLFKVMADFDDTIPRDETGLQLYAGVLARIAQEESLLPFERTAVAALAEHGARIAAQRERLTARFGRVADLAREAAFLARRADVAAVSGEHVREAVRRTKSRGDLPSRHFRRLLAQGMIRVRTSGAAVGEANGLAVIHIGPLSYGFPTRITASVGAGTAGAINIEREAELSGAIHTKGFYILGGLLRRLLRVEHPLAFDGSVAFEQSYGGIDGDSASAAEICCLLSALTDLPLRQDLAITGAIDQVGNILPVGAVNEKVEGFFDACREVGLTGSQGVLLPAANVGDLMLRQDVVDAARQGRFHVHAIDTIQQALALLTGVEPGRRDSSGQYPEHTLLGRAVAQARRYWQMSAARTDAR